jgi:flagellar biosynthesis component FlhA
MARPSRQRLLEASAVGAALYLTTGMLLLLPTPGNRLSRLVLVGAAVALAWVGTYGVAREWTLLVEFAALALAILGVWQAVAWVFILPVGAVLALAAVALARDEADDEKQAESDDDSESERQDGVESG